MRKQITYFDPRCPELEVDEHGRNMTVITNNQEEYDAVMASLNDPERGITNITTEELEPLFDEREFLLGLAGISTNKETEDFNL